MLNIKSSNLKTIADTILEATIVGSFSNVGYGARDRLFGLGPIDADLSGQRALVTGGTGGIGRAVAEGLVALGAHVTLTSRKLARAQEIAEEISSARPDALCDGLQLDTGDFDSILAAAETLRRTARIDMICHNAGALTSEYRTTEGGMEQTLASHLVGPYLLTKELRSHLVKGARVIWMSSGGMYTQGLDLDQLEMEENDYRGAIAYARAKRAQVELVSYLAPRWAPEVVMHSMHPGWVDTPGVEQGLPGFRTITGPILRTPEQGADTMIWLAATGGGSAAPGSFWLDRRPRSTVYRPGSASDEAQRQELVEWLELVTLPATVG